jgi:hypothetical protein
VGRDARDQALSATIGVRVLLCSICAILWLGLLEVTTFNAATVGLGLLIILTVNPAVQGVRRR